MAGACGNATRCVASLVMQQTGRHALTIRTARGLLQARMDAGRVWVNMGAPLTDWQSIPLSAPHNALHLPLPGDPVGVGMGNPHCVFVVADADAVALETLGPHFEHDPLFPQRSNVEFISLTGENRLRMRVWERGTGITLASGSSSCAVTVAAARRGLTARKVTLDCDGGRLWIHWREDGVWMTGPTMLAFDGVLTPQFLGAL